MSKWYPLCPLPDRLRSTPKPVGSVIPKADNTGASGLSSSDDGSSKRKGIHLERPKVFSRIKEEKKVVVSCDREKTLYAYERPLEKRILDGTYERLSEHKEQSKSNKSVDKPRLVKTDENLNFRLLVREHMHVHNVLAKTYVQDMCELANVAQDMFSMHKFVHRITNERLHPSKPTATTPKPSKVVNTMLEAEIIISYVSRQGQPKVVQMTGKKSCQEMYDSLLNSYNFSGLRGKIYLNGTQIHQGDLPVRLSDIFA